MRTGDGKAAAAAAAAAKTDARFPAVEIDEGRFKYVLIQATNPAGKILHLVRGYAGDGYHYHVHAATPTVNKLQEAGWQYEVLGGGRIQHSAAAKKGCPCQKLHRENTPRLQRKRIR